MVGNLVWHPAQAGIPIFWAKECLAQARASRLSEKAQECSVVGLTRSSGESFDVFGEMWTHPGECNSPKQELEAGSVRGARLGEVI